MRDIKFRVWTGKCYNYSPTIGEWDMEDCELFSGYNKSPSIIEQYTGLKDKNSKDIYEGDILGGICGLVVHWCDVCHGWQLTYSGEGCYSCSGDVMFNEYISDDLEVIGNIHENPELLT